MKKMLSLRSIVKNQCNTPIDVGEVKPEKKNRDCFFFESLHVETQNEKVATMLNSKQQTELLYALTYVMKSCECNSDCLQHISRITELLESPSQVIEFAAVTILQQIAKKYPKEVLRQSYGEILQRLMFFPSEEYAELICILLPNISPDDFNGRLLPILLEMLKSDEKFQLCASLILVSCTFNADDLTDEVFFVFLDSKALVTHYLLEITQKAIAVHGQSWFKSFFLPHLTTLSNSKEYSRPGIVRTVLTLCTEFSDPNVYSFLLSAFAWGSYSEVVAAEILNNCEFIMQTKKSEFGPKLKEFAMKLQQSQEIKIRVRVIDIISKHEQILYGSENHLRQFIKNAAEDPALPVKAAFLSRIEIFSQMASNNNIKELIFKYFTNFFGETNEEIRSLLLTSKYYSIIGAPKLTFLLPNFIRFTQSAGDRWRHFASCISHFVNFPDEVVTVGMKAMAGVLNQAVAKSPFALAESCFMFYTRLTCLVKGQYFDWLAQTVLRTYGQSKMHQLRAHYFRLTYILGYTLPYEIFKNSMWPQVLAIARDPVASVRVAFLRAAPKFFDYFRQQGEEEARRNLALLYQSFAQDEDPYVKSVFTQMPKKVMSRHSSDNEARIGSMQNIISGSTLPNLAKAAAANKKPIKPSPMKTLAQGQKFKNRSNSLSGKKGVANFTTKRGTGPVRYPR
jgi:hypothetical protein